MRIVPDIWPTWADLAGDIGCPYPTAHSWMRRGIPYRRFPALIGAAARRGVPLTYEQLAAAATRAAPKDEAA